MFKLSYILKTENFKIFF